MSRCLHGLQLHIGLARLHLLALLVEVAHHLAVHIAAELARVVDVRHLALF